MAIKKYGDKMIYEKIEENVPNELLDEREIFWIKELNCMSPNGIWSLVGVSIARYRSSPKIKCPSPRLDTILKKMDTWVVSTIPLMGFALELRWTEVKMYVYQADRVKPRTKPSKF